MDEPITDFRPTLVLFDLGGVLLDIDYSLTQRAFSDLGLQDVDAMYAQAAQSELFDELERGRLSNADFRSGIRRLIGVTSLSDAQIDKAWNALIGSLPSHRLDFVRRLRKKYTTALLSNTNEIHIACFEEHIQETIGMDRFRSSFDRIFYSSRIDARKPDRESFVHVLDEMDKVAEEVLFIDDSAQHIIAANAMGIRTVHLDPSEEVAERLSFLL